MTGRIEILQSMIEQDANNKLARYGLATELKNSGDSAGAVAQYEQLLKIDPRYSAAYFHGGQTLERVGRTDQAREWYQRGVEATRANGDAHAEAEMQAALDLLR